MHSEKRPRQRRWWWQQTTATTSTEVKHDEREEWMKDRRIHTTHKKKRSCFILLNRANNIGWGVLISYSYGSLLMAHGGEKKMSQMGGQSISAHQFGVCLVHIVPNLMCLCWVCAHHPSHMWLWCGPCCRPNIHYKHKHNEPRYCWTSIAASIDWFRNYNWFVVRQCNLI